MENKARVLTLDEVIANGDKLMWLEIKTANTPERFVLVPTSPYEGNKSDNFSIRFQSGHVQVTHGYNRYWRCWTEKPSVEDAMEW